MQLGVVLDTQAEEANTGDTGPRTPRRTGARKGHRARGSPLSVPVSAPGLQGGTGSPSAAFQRQLFKKASPHSQPKPTDKNLLQVQQKGFGGSPGVSLPHKGWLPLKPPVPSPVGPEELQRPRAHLQATLGTFSLWCCQSFLANFPD